MPSEKTVVLMDIYKQLLQHLGEQHWWPAESGFEVMIGAILTQQVNWRNVEKAISNLKSNGPLTPRNVADTPTPRLEKLIRPVGFYKQKAARVKCLCRHLLSSCDGDLARFFSRPSAEIRKELLSLKGVGPETADSMLLYAGDHAEFVVDAYTVRFLHRYGVSREKSYDRVKALFEANLPREVSLFKQYHALLVELGKKFCRTNPLCQDCPLRRSCRYGSKTTN